MTFEKALEAMKQGKKVRIKSVSDGKYLFIKDGKLMIYNPEYTMCISSPAILGVDLILSDDWEIYEEQQKELKMSAEKAKKILRTVRAESILCNRYFEDCTLDEFVSAVDLVLEMLKKQAKKEKEMNQLAETSRKILNKKCEDKCSREQDLRKLAFDKFTAGMIFGIDMMKDLQKENRNNA